MSEAISKDIVLDVTRFEYKSAENAGSINLRIETDGYDQMSKVYDAL